MPSPRVMVKSCVRGGREESFSEHPDAVRIFVCGFCARIFVCGFFMRIFVCGCFVRIFRADFCVRIFVRILDFQRADFYADLNFLLRRETAGRATQKSSPKNLPKILPKILSEILPEYLPVSPPLDWKNHGCTPGCPLPSLTCQCSSFWQHWAVAAAGLAGWC